MSKKQLFALFMCNLIPFIVGNSLMSLLPIYISNDLDAGTVVAGLAISVAFAVLVISTSFSASIARRFKNFRNLVAISALLCIPALWLSGTTNNAFLLTFLLSIEWFFGGLILAFMQIVAAISANPEQRGQIFGLLATAGPVGQIIGGFVAGTIVTRWNYGALFIFCAILYLVPVIASRLMTNPHAVTNTAEKTKTQTPEKLPMTLVFLMGASTLAYIANFAISMARPIVMDALQFDASAVSSTVTISGIVTLFLPLLAGWLSDRVGRYPVFIGAYVLTASGAGVYLIAGTMWQFWLAQALVSVIGSSMAVGSALVTDMVASENVDTSISQFGTTPWIGAVIGSMGSGWLIQQIGIINTFAISTGLILVAILLVYTLSWNRIGLWIKPVAPST